MLTFSDVCFLFLIQHLQLGIILFVTYETHDSSDRTPFELFVPVRKTKLSCITAPREKNLAKLLANDERMQNTKTNSEREARQRLKPVWVSTRRLNSVTIPRNINTYISIDDMMRYLCRKHNNILLC